MPSRIDEAGHTKAFDYPVAEHWGGKSKNEMVPGGIRTHKCTEDWGNYIIIIGIQQVIHLR